MAQIIITVVNRNFSDESIASSDTPSLRLLDLLDFIATRKAPFTLQAVVDETGLPKSTTHRMLQHLESAGILQREGKGRLYNTGHRLMQLSESVLLNNTYHDARHMVLRSLVEEVGESCNLTTFSGNEVLYLDRVDTQAPLRFFLRPGFRVPSHCSASGKLFLGQLAPWQRRLLLASVPLERYTDNTITDFDRLEREIMLAQKQGYAFDDEEFFHGLVCMGVLVPNQQGKSNMGIALQAPAMRFNEEKMLKALPALQCAAQRIAEINQNFPKKQ